MILAIEVLKHIAQHAEIGIDGSGLLALIVNLDGDHVAIMPGEYTSGEAVATDGHQCVIERKILAEPRLGKDIVAKIYKVDIDVAAATAVIGVALREAVSL